MTTTTITVATPAAAASPQLRLPATRAEWTKLWSLRATWAAMGVSVIAALALAGLATASDVRNWSTMTPAERVGFDPTSTSLIGVLFGALVLGALGVRTITSEYSSGMIRTTATAVPRRSHIIASKVVVVATATFVVALGANVAGFGVGQAVLGSEGIGVSLADRDNVLAVVLGAVAVSGFAVIGVGLGTIVQRASVANILIALVVIGGQVVGSSVPTASQRFLPFNALQASVTVVRDDDMSSPAVATAFIAAYAVAAVLAAAYVLGRRDV